MCGGICGPQEKISESKRGGNNRPKEIKQRKVPYNDIHGKVIRSRTYSNGSVEAIESKKTGKYFITYIFGPPCVCSGTKPCRDKKHAITEFNNMTREQQGG